VTAHTPVEASHRPSSEWADTASLPIWDVHGHYLPVSSIPLMQSGQAVVRLETVGDIEDSITLNGMAVGATIHQLASPDVILANMDGMGIDRRVLSPPPFTYRYWDEPERGTRLCRLLNDAHAQIAADHPERLLALGTVPLQEPSVARQELHRVVDELGLAGVTVGTNVAGRHLADPDLRSFFREAAEMNLPVLVHPDFVPNPRLADYYLVNLIGMPVETAAALANVILSGMLEEIPTLRLCFLHGGGAAPYLAGRWARGWEVRPETRRDTTRSPMEQIRTVYFDTLTHSPEALGYLVKLIGADHVVVGTDAPFDVEDPKPLETLNNAFGLSDDDRTVIQRHSPHAWLFGRPPKAPAGTGDRPCRPVGL
jgi:aminocarboxymuconate-semialdehyde decarboxylase